MPGTDPVNTAVIQITFTYEGDNPSKPTQDAFNAAIDEGALKASAEAMIASLGGTKQDEIGIQFL